MRFEVLGKVFRDNRLASGLATQKHSYRTQFCRYIRSGGYHNAVRVGQQGMSADPMDTEMITAVAKTFEKLGDSEAAAATYDRLQYRQSNLCG